MAYAVRQKEKEKATRGERASAAKAERIDLRATAAERKLLQLAAEKRGVKFSQFVIKSACNEAEVVLADQKHFELPAAQFAQFVEALDRPARVNRALQKLFAEPSILEQ